MAMFNVTRSPLGVGSYLRSRTYGSRIMVVTKVEGEFSREGSKVTIESCGMTHYGTFTFIQRLFVVEGLYHGRGMVSTERTCKTGRICSDSYRHVCPSPEFAAKYNL